MGTKCPELEIKLKRDIERYICKLTGKACILSDGYGCTVYDDYLKEVEQDRAE